MVFNDGFVTRNGQEDRLDLCVATLSTSGPTPGGNGAL